MISVIVYIILNTWDVNCLGPKNADEPDFNSLFLVRRSYKQSQF